jgi:hypothetical protein
MSKFGEEDRLIIWRETLSRLNLNTAGEWLLGHGIGSYVFEENVHISPHNAVLQLAFENGVLGLVLVIGGYVCLMWALYRASRRLSNPAERYLSLTLFALLCIEAGHCLLTNSIYSKYILYPLSIIIGASTVIIDKAGGESDSAYKLPDSELPQPRSAH